MTAGSEAQTSNPSIPKEHGGSVVEVEGLLVRASLHCVLEQGTLFAA